MPQDMYPGMLSPVRRLNERGDSSEMEEDDHRRSPLNVGLENNGSPNNGAHPKNNQNKSEKFKCAICDFETVSHDIYRNHLMLHATKDQESPPPTSFTSHHVDPSNLPNLPQYPLQIRSPLAINAEAKAAAAASALLRRARPLSSNESENEAPSSSIKQEQEKLSKLLITMKFKRFLCEAFFSARRKINQDNSIEFLTGGLELLWGQMHRFSRFRHRGH